MTPTASASTAEFRLVRGQLRHSGRQRNILTHRQTHTHRQKCVVGRSCAAFVALTGSMVHASCMRRSLASFIEAPCRCLGRYRRECEYPWRPPRALPRCEREQYIRQVEKFPREHVERIYFLLIGRVNAAGTPRCFARRIDRSHPNTEPGQSRSTERQVGRGPDQTRSSGG